MCRGNCRSQKGVGRVLVRTLDSGTFFLLSLGPAITQQWIVDMMPRRAVRDTDASARFYAGSWHEGHHGGLECREGASLASPASPLAFPACKPLVASLHHRFLCQFFSVLYGFSLTHSCKPTLIPFHDSLRPPSVQQAPASTCSTRPCMSKLQPEQSQCSGSRFCAKLPLTLDTLLLGCLIITRYPFIFKSVSL